MMLMVHCLLHCVVAAVASDQSASLRKGRLMALAAIHIDYHDHHDDDHDNYDDDHDNHDDDKDDDLCYNKAHQRKNRIMF